MEGTVVDDQAEAQPNNLVELAADLVATYVSNNRVSLSEIPSVIASVHAALSGLGKEEPAEPALEKPAPAQVRKSIAPDALISFIDGKPYKTLKRYVTKNGLTFEEYRARYGLSSDYPSTAASYSAKRSELARSLGLGQQRRKAAPMAAATDETVSEASKSSKKQSKAVKAPEAAPKARGRNEGRRDGLRPLSAPSWHVSALGPVTCL